MHVVTVVKKSMGASKSRINSVGFRFLTPKIFPVFRLMSAGLLVLQKVYHVSGPMFPAACIQMLDLEENACQLPETGNSMSFPR